MVWAPDSPDLWAPDSATPNRWAPDSGGHLTLGRAVDLFLAATAAEGAAAKTLEWYGMILRRAVRRFGEPRPLDAITAAELRAWLLELRGSLAPESIAGYVRGLKAFGNWCVAEELAAAPGFRTLRRPHVPRRLIAPFSDAEIRSLLALADERERALVLLLFDSGLRLSELVSLQVGVVRPDGTLHVLGIRSRKRSRLCRSRGRPASMRVAGCRSCCGRRRDLSDQHGTSWSRRPRPVTNRDRFELPKRIGRSLQDRDHEGPSCDDPVRAT